MLTVYAIETSEIYGHGNRVVIWFSGCSLRCPGCINKYLWDKASGKEYSVNALLDIIKGYNDIQGVTFIGGEPLEQGIDLLNLTKVIIHNGLDIVLFTGYELDELDELQKQIVALSVVVITGRYEGKYRDTNLYLRGSANQQIIFNNSELTEMYATEQRQVEIIITDEEDKYLGFPEDFL